MNTEYQLKPKLVWPVGTKYEIRKKGTGAMTTVKNEVFIGS